MSDVLSARASAEQTHAWLQRRRFGPHAAALCNFTGADLMRLSRDDVVQLCGLADGVRLYNSLHNKLIVPRLTVYVCLPPAPLYHAFYLYQTSRAELSRKLAALLGCGSARLRQVCVEGPGGVPVLLTDEVRPASRQARRTAATVTAGLGGRRADMLDRVLSVGWQFGQHLGCLEFGGNRLMWDIIHCSSRSYIFIHSRETNQTGNTNALVW